MKQTITEKYNIAWFKLAECVARGEKERALGVYRLLAHSFEDQAFSHQLEGDLLLVFNEFEQAKTKYEAAAQLYEKDNKLIQACAVYEHLITLYPTSLEYREKLLDLYRQQGIYYKTSKNAHQLFDQLFDEQLIQKAMNLIDRLESILQPNDLIVLYEKLIFRLVDNHTIPHEILLLQCKKAIDILIKLADPQKLEQFMARLHMINEELHNQMLGYITENEY